MNALRTCVHLTILLPGMAFPQGDWRNIKTGHIIPDETYSDQPYIVKTDDGAWLAVMTTGQGREGSFGQHIITWRSTDKGKTWVDKADVEPADGPEASYAVLLKVPSGRVYVFYNHNSDNIREIKGEKSSWEPSGIFKRVDSQGYFVFKFSDDNGKSWSDKRYTIPVREFEIDRKNVYDGKIRFFWNVGKAFAHNGNGYVPLHKVGGFGYGFFTSNEGVLLVSSNILTENAAEKITWETLPDGDIGLRTPPGGGPIAAEQSFSILSDGSFYCVYRSIDGHPVFTYSRDQGHTWDTPQYKIYSNGRLMKHPRAANFAWKCENGKFLYWFHNHGGKWYWDRNPVWISGGVEIDSPNGKIINWTQPEILLYDQDPWIRMSYPDLVEEDGEYYFSETQKNVARVHKIDKGLLQGLWNQFENDSLTTDGLLLEWKKGQDLNVVAPELPVFVERDMSSHDYGSKLLEQSFTIDLQFRLKGPSEGQLLCDARNDKGLGWWLKATGRGSVEFNMNDGRTNNRWECDRGLIESNRTHYVSVIVDGGPSLILFVVDGLLNDGGEKRQFGWGRFNPNFRSANGAAEISITSNENCSVELLRIYDRFLTVSEAIGNYRHHQ